MTNGWLHTVPLNSEPLKVFNSLKLLISHSLAIDSIKFFATTILLSLKCSRLSISSIVYSILLLKANALLAGIVQGVVVQIIILVSLRKSLLVSLTLNAT